MNKFISIPVNDYLTSNVDNDSFVKLKIYALSNGDNRNGSEFLRESFEDAIPTMYNKPLLAYYNPKKNDTEEHNSRLGLDEEGYAFYDYQYDGAEHPVGIIPESCDIYIETVDNKDWIVLDGVLMWKEYSRQLTKLIEKQKKKKVSVEIEVLESYMDENIERIKKFLFIGITILGEDIESGIADAHLEIKKFAESEEFSKFRKKFASMLQDNSYKSPILEKYLKEQEVKKNMALTHRELEDKLWAELSGYTYERDDYTNHKYWIEDILTDEDKVVVKDNETSDYYLIPYHVDEATNKIHLDMSNKKLADKKYEEKHYTESQYSLEAYASRKDWGTGDTIPVNKSAEVVSMDSWGSVKKTELRSKVLTAKNYKRLVKDVYLLVEEGWEDSPSSKLKYPVMQFKDGEFVYNAAGLLSAQQYGEKYDSTIADKAKRIRKKLGLLDKEKRENVKKFIESAKEAGLVLMGVYGGKLRFAKEDEACEDKTEMSVFEIVKEKCGEDHGFSWDELEEKNLKMADDDDDDDEDEKDKAEKEEMAKKIKALEADKAKMAKASEELEKCKAEMAEITEKCECAEKELKEMKDKKFKEDTDAILSDEDSDMDEKTKEELRAMRDTGEFASVEDFVKEMSYKMYIKKENKKEYAKNLSYELGSKKVYSINKNADPDIDELDRI